MPKEIPVDYNPFEQKPGGVEIPVDYNPFNPFEVVGGVPVGRKKPSGASRSFDTYSPMPYGGDNTAISSFDSPSPSILKSTFNALGWIGKPQDTQAILGLSREFNVSPSKAAEDFSSLSNKVFGQRSDPTGGIKSAAEMAMIVGVVHLAVTAPIATLVTIPAFVGLNAVYTAYMEKQHGLKGEGLTGFLPENTIQPVKDVVWLAEQLAQAYALSPLFKLTKGLDAKYTEPLKKAILEKWLMEVKEVFKPSEKLYVSPNKIRNYFGGGEVGERITPRENEILQTFGIARGSYRSAIKNGIDIEIPVRKIVTSADKPGWNEFKNFFRLSPEYNPPYETTYYFGDKPTIKPHVAGLLEAPPTKPVTPQRRSFVDIFKDVNRMMGDSERGSISEKGLTPEQVAAQERLKADFELIKEEAKKAGKEFGAYLKDVGFDEPSIAVASEMVGIKKQEQPTPPSLEPLAQEAIPTPTPSPEIGIKNAMVDAQRQDDLVKQGRTTEGIKTEQITPTETDVNTLLDMAAKQDKATPITDTSSYESIRMEAARLAKEKINKKIDFAQRKEIASVKNDTIENVKSSPVYQVIDEVSKTGGFDYDSLRELYSKEMVDELSKKRPGLVSKKGTYALDKVVSESDFFDGADDLMMQMLAFKGTKESVKQAEATHRRLMSDVEYNDYYIDVLKEEEKILTKLLKENAPKPAKELKKFIRQETGQIRIDELVTSDYDALKFAMKKAEVASRIAYREGNKLGALKEKTRQKELAIMLRDRLKAKEEVNKIRDGIIKISKNTKIPQEYQDQIASFLEDYDLLPRSSKGQRQVDSLRSFLDIAEASGEDVDISRSLLNKIERYSRVHWKDLTLEQLKDIYDQAGMIEHIGISQNFLIAEGKKRKFETSVSNIVETTKENFGITPETFDGMLQDLINESVVNPNWFNKLMDFKDTVSLELVKPERLIRLMDKWVDLGKSWRELYYPAKHSSDVSIRLQQEYSKKLDTTLAKFKRYNWDEKTMVKGIDYPMSREAIILTALNTGTEGNLDALRFGKRQWTDEQIRSILDALTPNEKELVRGTWDLIATLFDPLAKKYKSMTGRELKRVDGDYFPLVFDHTLSSIVDKAYLEAIDRDFFQSIYSVRPPNDGFVNERTGGKLDPLLKFSVVLKHISDVIHYISHAEEVRDMRKLLLDPRVRAVLGAIPEIGVEGHKQIVYWVQDLSKPKTEEYGFIEKASSYVRGAATTAILGTLSVATTQIMQITQTFLELGLIKTFDGLVRFYSSPLKIAQDIRDQSAEMSASYTGADREIQNVFEKMKFDRFYNQHWAKEAIFGLVSTLDMAIRYPTWLGLKRIGNDKFKTELEAREYADMGTRNSQGVALLKDLAAIQRGGALKKLVTMFSTFTNNVHNIIWEMEKKWKYAEGMKIPETWDLMRAFIYIMLLPAIWDVMRHREKFTWQNIGKETALNMFSRYPLVRDIAWSMASGYNYRTTPASTGIEKTIGFIREPTLAKGIAVSGYWIPGGMPSEMAAIAVQGYLDLKAGKTNDVTRLLFKENKRKQ